MVINQRRVRNRRPADLEDRIKDLLKEDFFTISEILSRMRRIYVEVITRNMIKTIITKLYSNNNVMRVSRGRAYEYTFLE